MPAAICFFLLFLLPFVIAPFGVTEFEVPKVVIGEGGIIVLFLLSFFFKNNVFSISRKQAYLYGVIGIVSVIDLLFFRSSISFFGNVFRMQGIFLLWLLLLFSVVSESCTFRNIPWYVFGLLLLVESIAIFFLPLNASQRYVGTLGEPNALAAFVIFLWPFAFFGVKKFSLKEKIGMGGIMLLIVLVLFLTDSKSAMIAFAIQVVAIVLYKKHFLPKKIVLICVCLYIISYLLPFFDQTLYENRVQVWQAALFGGFTHPLLGNGFGNIEFVLHSAAHTLHLAIQYYYVDSSHNMLFDWWVEAGLVGVSIVSLLTYYTVRKFIQTKNMREITLVLGMITVLSFNPASVVGLLGFWWLIGQGLKK